MITSPDQRTTLVDLQPPGGSTWPHHDRFDTPRSTTAMTTKHDGGVIGT